jgi:hypothetical protein
MKTFKEYLLLSEARGIFPKIHEVSERIYTIIYDKIIEDLNRNNRSVIMDFNKFYNNDRTSSIIDGQYVCNAGDEFVIGDKIFNKLTYRITIDFIENFDSLGNLHKDKKIVMRGASTQVPIAKHKKGKYIIYEDQDTIQITIKYLLNKGAILDIDPLTIPNTKNKIIEGLDELNSECVSAVSHELGHIFTRRKRNKTGTGFGEMVEYFTNSDFRKAILPVYNIKNIYKFYHNKYFIDKIEIPNYPTQIYSSLFSHGNKRRKFETKNDLINAIKNNELYKKLDEIHKFSYNNFINGLKEKEEKDKIIKFLEITEITDFVLQKFHNNTKIAHTILNVLENEKPDVVIHFLRRSNLTDLIPLFEECVKFRKDLINKLKNETDILVIKSFLDKILNIFKQRLEDTFYEILPPSELFSIGSKHVLNPTAEDDISEELNKIFSDEVISKYKKDPEKYYETEIEKMQKIAEREKRKILRIVSFYDENTQELTPI